VKKEEWITAADALRLLKPVFGEYTAQLTICKRAYAGLIRARAEHYMINNQEAGAREVPKGFWWDEGHSELEQNWTSGDFTTYTNRGNTRHRAFGVSFSRADIEKLIPTEPEGVAAPKPEGETGGDRAMEWDVFISHASEDKEDFVRPLAETLRRSGLRVWYDDFTLKVGDSLHRSIDHGLAKSRYGIVVISPNFLKKVWPQKELDGLVAREGQDVKVILPVWHNIGADGVRRYSLTLADRVAVSSSKGIDHVTRQLMQTIEPRRREELETQSIPQLTPLALNIADTLDGNGARAKYVRVSIKNVSMKDARRCSARLTRIDYQNNDGTWRELAYKDTLDMAWANKLPGTQEINLGSNSVETYWTSCTPSTAAENCTSLRS
jgi:TIR domain